VSLQKLIPAEFLNPIMREANMRGFNKRQLAHFISQTMHESGGYKRLVENLNYSELGLRKTWPSRFNVVTAKQMARKPEMIANHVYANRLGNILPGDGWMFRGRGIIQLTGRHNYREASEGIYQDLRLLTNPDILLNPDDAVKSAFWYWDKNKLKNIDNVTDLTRRINGGTIGLADRQKRFNDILKILG
jgi:putative chitinase